MKYTLKFDDRQFKKLIRNIKRKAQNPYPLLKLGAMTYGFKDIINHFREESGPRGSWKKRTKRTQLLYARLNKIDSRYNPANKLLQLMGLLRKSLLPAKGETEKKGKYGILLFTDVPYARRQNRKRKFMWLSNQAGDKMADLVVNGLVR